MKVFWSGLMSVKKLKVNYVNIFKYKKLIYAKSKPMVWFDIRTDYDYDHKVLPPEFSDVLTLVEH